MIHCKTKYPLQFALLILILFFNSTLQAQPAKALFSATSLSPAWQNQIKTTGLWQPGCPVKLEDLQVLTISYYDFAGKIHNNGEILLNKSATPAALNVFKALYAQHFPLAAVDTLIKFNGNWQRAETENVSYGFLCRKYQNHYTVESSGKVITINPVQNPQLTLVSSRSLPTALWCKVFPFKASCQPFADDPKIIVFPSAGMLAINRNLKLKGMVEKVVPIFTENGFVWNGFWKQQINWKKFIFMAKV